MTRKRMKVLAATVAAGLLSGTVVQIPYNVLAVFPAATEVTGGVASAALSPEALEVLKVLDNIKSKMTDEERAAVGNTRAALATLNDVTLLNPIWDGIDAKLKSPPPGNYSLVTKENVLALVKDFHFFYVSDQQTLEQMWIKHRDLIYKLVELGGQSKGDHVVNFTDFSAFYVAVVNAAKAKLSSPTEIARILLERGGVSGLIDVTLEEALNNNSLVFSKVFNNLGITGAELIQVKNSMGAIVDSDQAARDALAIAYLRTETVFSSTASTNGRVVTPKITILGKDIPNNVLSWSVKSGSNVTYNASQGAFVLADTATNSKVTIEAKLLFIDKMLYRGDVELTAQNTGSGGGGGGGGGVLNLPTLPTNFQANITRTLTTVQNMLAAIPAGASEADVERVRREAKRFIENELRKLAIVDVKSFMQTQQGKRVLALDSTSRNEIKKHMKTVKEQADALNKLLLSADPNATPAEIEFTLDFGTGDNFEIVIPFELINEARTLGIDKVGGLFNGMTITIHADEPVSTDITIRLQRLNESAAANATSFKIGSDVYDIELYVNGVIKEDFVYPVTLRIPVKNVSGLDKELLVIAKLVGNGLQVFTGYYNEDGNFVEVERDTLSRYVVIENKLVFEDLESVIAWAGRAIEVTAAQGIFEGRPGKIFDPNANITRAEFAKVLVSLFQLADPEATESFGDVSATDWFRADVAAAVKAGIIRGRSASTFDPNAPITRAEMATMTARALVAAGDVRAVKDVASYVTRFTDADEVLPGLAEGIALMVRDGYMQGVPGGAFQPDVYATRAQAAVMLYRILQSR